MSQVRKNKLTPKDAPPVALLNRRSLGATLIALLALLAMYPVMSAGFVTWDDNENFAQNPTFHPPTLQTALHFWREPHMHLYVPVTYTLWAGLAIISADDSPARRFSPALFHTTNLLLHVLTSLVVWALLRRLIGTRKSSLPALIGAILFAVHPLQVEAVGWASGTKDLLAALFMWSAVWSLLASMDSSTPSRRWGLYGLATSLVGLAMLSKPSSAVTPVVAAIVLIIGAGQHWRRISLLLIPWLAMSVACVIGARSVQPPSDIVVQPPLMLRPLIAGDSLAFYIYKLVWPAGLTIDHGRRPDIVLSSGQAYFTWIVPVVFAAIILWGWRQIRRRERAAAPDSTAPKSLARVLVAGALVTGVCIGPVSGLAPFDFQQYSTVAEHYMYPAMAGVAMMIAVLLSGAMGLIGKPAAAFERGLPTRMGAIWVSAFILLVLAIRSNLQARVWTDDFTLFSNAVKVNPQSGPGQSSLALVLLGRQQAADALPHAQRAVDLNPKDGKYWAILSNARRQAGHLTQAIEAAERTVELTQGDAMALSNLGGMYAEQSELLAARGEKEGAKRAADAARKTLEAAILRDPTLSDAHLNLGTFYGQNNMPVESIRELTKAVELNPQSIRARSNLGTMLLGEGRLRDAREQFLEVLKIQPNWPAARDGMERIRRAMNAPR